MTATLVSRTGRPLSAETPSAMIAPTVCQAAVGAHAGGAGVAEDDQLDRLAAARRRRRRRRRGRRSNGRPTIRRAIGPRP